MMLTGYPDNETLASIGKVSVRHGQLDYAFKMCVKAFIKVSHREALDATDRIATKELRERVRKLAKQALGEGEALVKLDALATRARRASDKRNELLHGVWAQELDGEPYLFQNGERQPQPTSHQLDALAEELASITFDLHEARLNGWLKHELDRRQLPEGN